MREGGSGVEGMKEEGVGEQRLEDRSVGVEE